MRSPRLVRLAAIVFAALGVIGLYFGWPPGDRWLLFGGVVLLVLAPMVWFGIRVARVPAAIVALIASWPLVYGLWGLTVVATDHGKCSDGSIASIALTSYPADYCNIVDWGSQFGTGFALVGLGLAGVFVLLVVLINADHFTRSLSGQIRQPT